MNLTLFTDYALRTLIYLGAHPEKTVPASVISEAFDISPDHVAKAAKWLTQRGYVRATRGKTGGLTLACVPSEVRLGRFIRESEPHSKLLECFDPVANRCALTPACRLKKVLFEAHQAFFEVLDRYTLQDVLQNAPELLQLLPASALSAKSR
jgi:Rrf2 family nitric oxide-sensitive transcriptional repressor